MNVKQPSGKMKIEKRGKWALGVLLVAIVLLAGFQLQQEPDDDWQANELELALRAIGHQVLASGGDLTTPVPPIEKIDEKTYRLNFPHEVVINPDALSEEALNALDASLVSRALIRVHSTAENQMAYGFEINHDDQRAIPCLGRNLDKAGYYIDMVVEKGQTTSNEYPVAMMSMAGIGLALLLFSGLPKGDKSSNRTLTVAGFALNGGRSQLSYKGKEIELTKRELSLAVILMENAGNLVTRDYLIEQVWSKDGVVTGRSLDVFISRLRKKFAISSEVEIVNKHGKGYLLKVYSGLKSQPR